MKKVFIIAEAGVNHNGDINLAKKLIDVAYEAGADAVKFQTFIAKDVVCENASKAQYQKETTTSDESQLDMLKKLELSKEDYRELHSYCEHKGIMFLSTPFDLKSIEFLDELGVEIFKIPSGEITNLPYLRKLASLGKELILSTGVSSMEEIKDAVDVLKCAKKLTVLHCNSQYPTPFEDVNLNAMIDIKNQIGSPVGYSDHTQGVEVAIAAVAMGASVVEKHFTLDKNLEGPDHKASLEPDELKYMVHSIRNIEKSLGDGGKQPSQSELENKSVIRKFIVASENIVKGEVFSEENLTAKRSGGGISPMKWDEIIGQSANKNFKKDDIIEL